MVPVRIIILILQPLGSLSRLHAVIQYRGDGDAFLYDCGSTHGTFLNKRRLKARVHAPLRVGDTFHLAESTRTYFFQGPSELAPAADVITKRASEEAARQQQQEAMRGNPKPTPRRYHRRKWCGRRCGLATVDQFLWIDREAARTCGEDPDAGA